jgi:outer membrane lipoprotein LolB
VKRAAALAVALFIGACAQAPLRAPEGALDFDVAGRIAVRYGKDGFTGNLAWRHARRGDEVMISTPLGQGVARLVREGDAVQLITSEGREFRAADAETLTERVLGFRLPLEGLADWIQGRPSPGAPARTETGDDGRLRALEQSGWRVEFQEYQAARPQRLRLTYPGIELRLVVAQWK